MAPSFKKLLLALVSLALVACDNPSSDTSRGIQGPSQQGAITHAESPAPEPVENLAERYAGQEFRVVDASEIELDGAKVFAVTFSLPLARNQKIDDFVYLDDSVSGRVDGAWELSENTTMLYFRHVEPRRSFTLTVDPGLLAITGRTLDEPYTVELKSSDLVPSVGFASRGSLLPTRLADGLPVITLNVDEVEVEFFRVREDRIAPFAAQRYNTNRMYSGTSVAKDADLVYSGRFRLDARPNTRETVLLPILDLKPLRQPGVYFAVMRARGDYQYTLPATMFTLSDIGLSAHRYRQSLEVFAQSLEQGQALTEIRLELFDCDNKKLAETVTDAQGRAELPLTDKASLIVARKGEDITLLPLNTSALNLSEFDITGAQPAPLQFFVFGPRNLYRPGETVLINGLLRDADGRAVDSRPIAVSIVQSDGRTKRSFAWQPEETGFYQYRLPLSANDPTGPWRISFDLGDPQRKTVYTFQVEEFLPERMALELEGSRLPLAIDVQPEFTFTGRYLYGAPASGNRLIGELHIRPLREAVAALPGYEFGSVSETFPSMQPLPDVTLDEKGTARIRPENQWKDLHSPLMLGYVATLQESGGRPVTRRLEQPVWPAERMPGIRPLFDGGYADRDGEAEFDIVMTDVHAHKLAADGLAVRLIRERRDFYWSYVDGQWESRYSEKIYTVAERTLDIAQDRTARVSFPVEWGAYRIEVEDPRTQVVSSLRFWAGRAWQDTTGPARPDQVRLTLDKAAYTTGDVATVTVVPPVAGSGYLMVESSEGPLWWQPIEVPAEGRRFDIPIPQEWARHDLYISALVIRPGDRRAYSTPKRAVGIQHLPFDRHDRKLALTLAAPEKMRPNRPLKVTVRANAVAENLPANTRVLVSAVDEGILNITGYVTPDPFENFFGRKRYAVDQFDVYGHVIEAGKNRPGKLVFGGDAPANLFATMGGAQPDTPVQLVALQSEVVTLDERGEAEITLDVPDFNGALRIMAQAWSDDRFGSGETVTVVAAPLVAELSAPRFLAAGDESRVALDLTNLSGRDQRVKLRLSAEDPLRPTDVPAEQSLAIAQGKRHILTLPVSASGTYGSGRISLSVAGLDLPDGDYSVEKRWQIGVRPAYPARVRYFREALPAGESWTLPAHALDDFEPHGLELLVGLGSRPPLYLAEQIRELNAYPYGCVEQIVSGLYPSLYVTQAALKTLGMEGESDEKRQEKIHAGIGRIIAMQRGNGSFSMWNPAGEEEYWLTVYVTDFLLRAREQGYDVPDRVLENATNRLLRYLQNDQAISPGYSRDARHLRFSVRAYAGYVLARSQRAPLGALRALHEQRNTSMTALPLVQLGIAFKLMGDDRRADQALAEGLNSTHEDTRSGSQWYGDYGSPLRDEAVIYALLEEYDLYPGQRPARLLKLSDRIAATRWFSTQERNAIFMAGRTLLSGSEQEWRGVVSAGARSWPLDPDRRQVLIDGGAADMPLNISNPGQQALYLTAGVSGYPKRLEPVSSHLSVTREYLRPDGEPLELDSVTSGDLILVHLEVAADAPTPDALVVDLLPAGLELENQNLGDSAASLADAGPVTREWLQAMKNNAYNIRHQEFRDDRYIAAVRLDGGRDNRTHLLYLARAVTPGRYRVPPPTIHAMYRPEWQAVGKAPGRLTVLPR